MAGFTKLDNELLQKILTTNLTKRQLKILLLIIRFSYGYQKSYAILRKNDFFYAGVSPYCITDELKRLVRKRVIRWDAKRDLVCINYNTHQWAVDRSVKNPGEKAVSFFKLATKNSMKQQFSIYQNSKPYVAETATPYIDRKKLKKDKEKVFLKLLRDYFLKVAPLNESELVILHRVVESYPPRAIEEAIDAVSSEGERSFSSFLKALDGLASNVRSGGMTSINSSLKGFWRRMPRS